MPGRGRGRPPYPDVLTPAEQRVLDELRKGGTNAEIAVRLGRSVETVRTHIASMLAKLDLADRDQLATWRPEGDRRRRLAIPAVLASLGRPALWVGGGLAAAIAMATLVALLVAALGSDDDPGPLSADRCPTPADPTCIRAVYLGAPGDYAQVQDIPADVLLTPNSDGRYYVERGHQYTVVTAAPLPTGWTRFYLDRTPPETLSPVSGSQLIAPVGTTYTFTVTTDPGASTLITFDLKQARPFVRPRPDGKPEIGDTVVTTVFSVVNCESGVAVASPTTNTELVEDCESLVKAKDRLAGTATLNWTAGRPMTNWEGVTVAGTPQRVTKLELANSGLTGEITGLLGNLTELTHLRLNANALTGRIPSKLQPLKALTHLYLANDALTGCLPASLRSVSNNDLPTLNLPDCGPLRRVSDEPRVPLLEGGQTVSYQFLGTEPFLLLDLPEGYTYRIQEAITDTGPARVTFVVVTDEDGYESWVVFDADTGKEYYRRVSGAGGIYPDGRTVGENARRLVPLHPLNDVFDRISESAWLQE